jgi:hypothetical protein
MRFRSIRNCGVWILKASATSVVKLELGRHYSRRWLGNAKFTQKTPDILKNF